MNQMIQSPLIAAVAFQLNSNTRMGPTQSKPKSMFSQAKWRRSRIWNSLETQDRLCASDRLEHLLCAGRVAGFAGGRSGPDTGKEAVLAPSGGLRFGGGE